MVDGPSLRQSDFNPGCGIKIVEASCRCGRSRKTEGAAFEVHLCIKTMFRARSEHERIKLEKHRVVVTDRVACYGSFAKYRATPRDLARL